MSFINQLQEQLRPSEFYHGSPYEFDKFNMSKVGSGDGLNKYGYGLYFADNEDLANYYASEDYKNKGKVMRKMLKR